MRIGGRILAVEERIDRGGVEQIAAAARDEAALAALVDEAEEGEEPRPGAAPLLHRVGIARGVVGELGVQRAHAVALIVEPARLTRRSPTG